MTSTARGALPAAVTALAWLGYGVAFAIGDRADPRMPAILLLAALLPAGVAARSAWQTSTRTDSAPPDRRWAFRAGAAAVIVLLLIPMAWGWIQGPGPLIPAWPDSEVMRLVPGPGEAWAYLALVALTIGVVAGPVSARAAIATLAASTLGAALAVLLGLTGTGPPGVGCGDPFVAPASGSYRSVANGDLDGRNLGSVDIFGSAGSDGSARVEFTTLWNTGRAHVGPTQPAARLELARATLGDGGATADDLGFDRISGAGPGRHCQEVIDGASALRAFPALRWLVGVDGSTLDPGRGYEAWRGTLDYWLTDFFSTDGTVSAVWVLASVAIDGQPPSWPLPGTHASLRATISFEPHG